MNIWQCKNPGTDLLPDQRHRAESMPPDTTRPSLKIHTSVTHSECPCVLLYNSATKRPLRKSCTKQEWS